MIMAIGLMNEIGTLIWDRLGDVEFTAATAKRKIPEVATLKGSTLFGMQYHGIIEHADGTRRSREGGGNIVIWRFTPKFRERMMRRQGLIH